MASQQQVELSIKGWEMIPYLFDIWDADSSGTIDRTELVSGMVRVIEDNGLQLAVALVESIMQDVDLNDDHVLDKREFGYFLSRVADAAGVNIDTITSSLVRQKEADARRNAEAAERAWAVMPELFDLWDFDEDGSIGRDEVIMALQKYLSRDCGDVKTRLSIAECLVLIEECDSDEDRALGKREFGAFIARFSLATGAPIDRLVDSLVDECKRLKNSRTGRKISSFCAKIWVGMAEEELLACVEARRAPSPVRRVAQSA